MASTGDARRRPVPGALAQAVAEDAAGTPIRPSRPYMVTLSYAESNGFVDGVSPQVRPNTLAVYGLDEGAALWVRLPSQADPAARTVMAFVTDPAMTVFALIGRTDTSLGDVFVYPQPFDPGKGQAAVFANIAQAASLELFTAAGGRVRSLREEDGDGRLPWDGRDDSGRLVPPGVYFYFIRSATDKKSGKLMVVR
jgi:hypothetical protein